MPRDFASVAVAVAIAVVAACETERPAPTEYVTAQQCLPETCDGGGGGGYPTSDPDSSAPGIWVGINVGLSRCYSPTGAGINDADHDRFDDWCEQWIAYNFRPALRTNQYDCDLRSEPAWSVKYIPSNGIIRVGYWLSYYNDCGNHHHIGCTTSNPWTHYCMGHDGDSEFIVVDLLYHAATDHYVLQRAFMSAHWGTDNDYSANAPYSALEYPGKHRGYPRSWVALGKHGNYPKQAMCNSGAPSDADSCEGNSVENRMAFDWNRNLGSLTYRRLDCTPARPEMQYFRPGIECYWDGYDPNQQPPSERFFGWWWQEGANPYAGGATPYGPMIRTVFEPATLPPGSVYVWLY